MWYPTLVLTWENKLRCLGNASSTVHSLHPVKANSETPDDDYPWRYSLGLFDLLSNELIDMIIDNFSGPTGLVTLEPTCQGF